MRRGVVSSVGKQEINAFLLSQNLTKDTRKFYGNCIFPLWAAGFSWQDIYSMAKDLGFDGIEIRGLGRRYFLQSMRRRLPGSSCQKPFRNLNLFTLKYRAFLPIAR